MSGFRRGGHQESVIGDKFLFGPAIGLCLKKKPCDQEPVPVRKTAAGLGSHKKTRHAVHSGFKWG